MKADTERNTFGKGESKVSQQKMGTHYVREICQTFQRGFRKNGVSGY